MVIIFWDFLTINQILFSPQVKESIIWPNDSRISYEINKYHENLKTL